MIDLLCSASLRTVAATVLPCYAYHNCIRRCAWLSSKRTGRRDLLSPAFALIVQMLRSGCNNFPTSPISFFCTASRALVTFLACPRKVTQRRAPYENSFTACSVVLGTFRKLALRAQTVRNASPSDSVACLKFSKGIVIGCSPRTPRLRERRPFFIIHTSYFLI